MSPKGESCLKCPRPVWNVCDLSEMSETCLKCPQKLRVVIQPENPNRPAPSWPNRAQPGHRPPLSVVVVHDNFHHKKPIDLTNIVKIHPHRIRIFILNIIKPLQWGQLSRNLQRIDNPRRAHGDRDQATSCTEKPFQSTAWWWSLNSDSTYPMTKPSVLRIPVKIYNKGGILR